MSMMTENPILAGQALGSSGKALRKDLYWAKYGYEPHEAQEQIHYDTHRHKVLACGRRWGKTLLGGKEAECTCWVLNRFSQVQQGWIVGPQYSDAEKEFRVVYNTLRSMGVDDLSPKFQNNVESGNMHIRTSWGWDLQCRSARHPDTLVGEGLDFVIMVEAGRHRRKTWGDYI
ncbi:MAG: hypothetical protein ACRD1R_09675, partial [Acidobacteriota bacterium]